MIGVKLSVLDQGDHVVITLRGELDLADAPYLGAALAAVADRDPWMVVDLTDLEHVDCSGMAAFAGARWQARQAGGDLLLAAPRPQVMRLLTGAGLAQHFCFYGSVAEAVSGIADRERAWSSGTCS